MSVPSRFFVASFALALIPAVPLTAFAQGSRKSECAAAYEKSQESRSAGRLREAKEELVVCAQEDCPAFVQSDCAQWLGEVQREMPTIILSARDKKNQEVSTVRVSLDGQVVLEELDGKPMEIDPGQHLFRFEIEDAEPVEQKIVVRQSQKDRVIEVSFAPPEEAGAESPYAGAAQLPSKDAAADVPPPEEAPRKPGPLRMYAYVAGGVGAAGILGFVAFGAMGRSKESDLRDSCSPDCPQSEVDSVKTKYLLADVSLGLGIAGLGAGVALFFLSQPKSRSSSGDGALKFDVRTARDVTYATVSGRF